MSHTASRIFYISFAPWNKVYVAVKHGLPCARAVVYTNIESGHRRVILLNVLFSMGDKLVACVYFGLSQLKISYGMSFRNNEGMHVGNRKTISYSVGQLYAILPAKRRRC